MKVEKKKLETFQDEAPNTEDIYQREDLIKNIGVTEKELTKLEKILSNHKTKIIDLRRQIRELKESDRQASAKSRQQSAEKAKSEILAAPDFTGIVQFVLIEEGF